MSQAPTRLFNRDFTLLWLGQAVSSIGTNGYGIAMMYWVYTATGSATLMATAMIAQAVPGILLSPIGGTVADNISRKKIIIFSDVINGIAMLVLSSLFYTQPENVNLLTGAMITMAAISGTVGAFFGPAINASIPDLIPRSELNRANSLMAASGRGLYILGVTFGMIIYQYVGPLSLFIFNGISFLVSAISEGFIVIPQKTPDHVAINAKQRFKHYFGEARDGFQYIWDQVGLRALMVGQACWNIFITPFRTLLLIFVTAVLALKAEWVGYMAAALATGNLLGYLYSFIVNVTPQRRKFFMVTLPIIQAVALFLMGFLNMVEPNLSADMQALLNQNYRFVAMGIFFLVGFCGALYDINAFTLIQASTPGRMRGRVFSVLGAVMGSLAPLAMAGSGLLLDYLEIRVDQLFAVCGVLLLIVCVTLASTKAFRNFASMDLMRMNPDEPTPAPQSKVEAETATQEEESL